MPAARKADWMKAAESGTLKASTEAMMNGTM